MISEGTTYTIERNNGDGMPAFLTRPDRIGSKNYSVDEWPKMIARLTELRERYPDAKFRVLETNSRWLDNV